MFLSFAYLAFSAVWGARIRFRLQIATLRATDSTFGTPHGNATETSSVRLPRGRRREFRAAALRARIHYLDITAEQASALATFDRFGDAARDAGVAVVPAMGFYGGLSDLLVTAAASGWDAPDEVRIGIALDSWHPTVGTRITGHRNTARRLIIIDGRLAPVPQPAPESTWDFPEPFGRQDVVQLPFSEVALIARHLPVAHLRCFINQGPLRDLRDPITPPPRAVDERGRSPQTFLVEAIVRAGADSRRAVARGLDIYAVTAPLVCEAVDRILGGAVRQGGAFAPGELFDADDFLRTLSPQQLTFEPASCVASAVAS
jgi:short subunit dehydrogenase-like uncharacterized protein